MGERPSLTPRHSGTLFTTYQLTPAVRARRRPQRAQRADAEPQPGGHRRAELRHRRPDGRVRLQPAVALKVNVINVTNKLYADSLYTGHYIPGQPRTVYATMTARF